MEYKHLLSPLKVRNLRFANRIFYAPVGDNELELFDEMGKGLPAVATIGSLQIDEEWSMLMGYPDPFAQRKGFNARQNPKGAKILRNKMLAVQQAGSYCSAQLMHAGMYAHNYADKNKEGYAIGPNTEEYMHKKGMLMRVSGMDKGMIEHVSDNYAKAAKRFVDFGFDMIMLHFAHGWLPWQFLSPTYNKRTDEFGGSFENRIKFPMMIVNKVRETVGNDIVIEMRIGATDYRKDPIDFNEIIKFVQMVEDKIDLVHVSSGLDSDPSVVPMSEGGNLDPHCFRLHWAAELKKHVHIPVGTVGSVIYPWEAEEAIASGQCDYVCIGHGITVDPDWSRKVIENRPEDIMPCLRCTSCSAALHGNGVGCASNPRQGRYFELPKTLEKADNPIHLVIVGGGPAGIRAALFATERGHRVTLLEKSNQLGGVIKNFYDDKYKVDLQGYHQYLVNQIKKHPEIDVRLNTEATKENVSELKPDAILVAVGAIPKTLDVKGIETAHVIDALDAFAHPELVKGDVVILGAGVTACDTAIHLAEKGHKVDMIARSVHARELGSQNNWLLRYDHIIKQYKDYKIHEHTTVKEINQDEVTIIEDGKEIKLHADTIIMAVGYQPNPVADDFYDICYKTYKIGDCYRPAKLAEATNQAYNRVRNL